MQFIPQPYLDPGSGSFIVQILIGVLLAAGVTLRIFWGKIKGWLGIKSNVTPDEDDETN